MRIYIETRPNPAKRVRRTEPSQAIVRGPLATNQTSTYWTTYSGGKYVLVFAEWFVAGARCTMAKPGERRGQV